jgi:hypothetical protein
MNKKLVAALAVLVFGGAAQAQGYVAGSVGHAQVSLNCSASTSCDKSDTAYRLIGGWEFAPGWAAEIAYYDYGEGQAANGAISGTVHNTALALGAAYTQDLAPDWSVSVRAGLASVNTGLSGTAGGVASNSDSDRNVRLVGGLGVGYKLRPDLTLDVGLDFGHAKYDKNGVSTSGRITLLSLGLKFKF